MAVAARPQPAPNGFPHPDEFISASGGKTHVEERNIIPRANKSRSPGRPKKAAEDESLLRSFCAMICENQIGISVNLLLLLFLTHIFFPRARRRTSKFFHISYYNPETELYGFGLDDLCFAAFLVVVFTGLRVLVMEYILDPFARFRGIKSRKGLVRFKEQGWLLLYASCSWTTGMYIAYNSDFWLNLNGMWHGWPFREAYGLWKCFYLVEFAFYLQQIIVVNIEEKRKDYAQMFVHHIFTCSLIFLSYGCYHIRVGIAILCLMDLVDVILPAAKLLKYMGSSTACDVMFGAFVVAWFVTRHIFYPMVIWSVYQHTLTAIPPGCYTVDGTYVPSSSTAQYVAMGGREIWGNMMRAYTDRNAPVCWTPKMRHCFLFLLIALQAIILMWFVMIVKVVYQVIRGQNADDVRSDDEGEDTDVETEVDPATTAHPINAVTTCKGWTPVEEEVGVEGLSLNRKSSPGVRNYKRSANRNSGSRASGISIGHSDRKELLGRIGCDKPT